MRSVGRIAILVLCVHGPARAQEPKQPDVLAAFEKQLKTTIATAGPSIACVVVSHSDQYPKPQKPSDIEGKLGGFDKKAFLKNDTSSERLLLANHLDLSNQRSIPDHGYAGGVVIDSSGLVLTPYHVIDGATKVYVFLPGGVGSYADIHAADARSDLAVLKLINPPAKLTAIKYADLRTRSLVEKKPSPLQGKLVVLMTLPYSSNFRLDQPSAAWGSITNVRDRLPPPPTTKESETTRNSKYYEYGPLLEFDWKMNEAVTGGALLNLNGELLGITTAGATVYDREIGPGYAIPADDYFRRVVDVLRKGEEVEYGFLGVQRNVDGGLIPIPQGPAENAGMKPRDVITKINGLPVRSFNDLLLHIGNSLAGTTVKVTVVRQGVDRPIDLDVTLAKFKHDLPSIASVRPEPVFGLRVDYGTTREPQPTEVPRGVIVRELVADSPAAKKFKTLGDDPKRWVIVKVNGIEITNPAEFYKAAKGQDKVKLTLTDPSNPIREHELTLP